MKILKILFLTCRCLKLQPWRSGLLQVNPPIPTSILSAKMFRHPSKPSSLLSTFSSSHSSEGFNGSYMMVRMVSLPGPSIAKASRLYLIAIEWSRRVDVLAVGTA